MPGLRIRVSVVFVVFVVFVVVVVFVRYAAFVAFVVVIAFVVLSVALIALSARSSRFFLDSVVAFFFASGCCDCLVDFSSVTCRYLVGILLDLVGISLDHVRVRRGDI